MTDSIERDQLDTVRIAAEGVAEMDRQKRAIFIPREDIVRLEVGYGSGADRPVILLLVSVMCFALAAGLMTTFVLAIVRGNVRVPASLITSFTFLIPAWWFADLAIRKRWFIAVHTRTVSRKLVFQHARDQHEIIRFLQDAKSRYGYA